MPYQLPFPLGGSAPAEIMLERPPLEAVVAQIRFSSVLKIESQEGVAAFQEELRGTYPFFAASPVHYLHLDPSTGVPNVRMGNAWRFSDADRVTTIVLTSEAMTLEARQYEGRAKFTQRWAEALGHLQAVYHPGLALRCGVRYLNRVGDDSLERLAEWVRPNLIGVAEPELRAHVTQAMSEAAIRVAEGELILRWGILPPNGTVDPNLLAPSQSTSWVLDIDVASSEQATFDADALDKRFAGLAERAYAVFRWIVTESGVEHFGGRR